MTYQPVSLQDLLVHQGWALRVARRLVREEGEAEDLVQRTWIAALRSPPATERGSRAWIRKVILNLARERHRRNLVRERHERSSVLVHTSPDAFESLSRAEIHKLLGERLLELSEPYRNVVLLRYYENLSSAEIARRLGIPAGTVRWRLKVGLDQLRTELDRSSGGDRTRWVSALLLFAPPSAPLDPENDSEGESEGDAEISDELERPPMGAASAGLGTNLVPALGGLAFVAASLFALYWLVQSPERTAAADGPAQASLESRAPASPSGDALGARRTGSERLPAPSTLPALPEPPQGLRISVVDAEGKPQANARVLVANSSGFEERLRSDAEGLAWLTPKAEDIGGLGLAATQERVSLRALADGRAASPLVHVAAPFTPEHEVRLVVGGPELSLRGRVLDQQERPMAGALVAWFDPASTIENAEGDFASPSYLAVESGPDGSFHIQNLPPGRGHLGCLAKGYAIYSMPLDAAEAPASILLHLLRGAAVSGIVRKPDGTPAAGVTVGCEPLLKAAEWATGLPGYDVRWRGFGETTRSDENGRYRLEGVSAWHPRRLWALDQENGLVASTTRKLVAGTDEHWDVELAVEPGYRLRLVDERGHPLPTWVVHLRRPMENECWWIRRSAADAEGRVNILDSPEGLAYLDVFAPRDVGASFAWRRLLPSTEEQLIEVDTRATTSIRGQLLDASGQPELRGQLVVHSVQTTLGTPVERDAEGYFDQRLVPGNYVLTLQLDQTAAPLAEFSLKANEQESFGTIVTPPMGLLRLNAAALFNGTKRPPAYSIFRLPDERGERGILKVANGPISGEAMIPAFPGRYRVMAFDGAGAKPRHHEVIVVAHVETRLDLQP